jgi:hypothetical protein
MQISRAWAARIELSTFRLLTMDAATLNVERSKLYLKECLSAMSQLLPITFGLPQEGGGQNVMPHFIYSE